MNSNKDSITESFGESIAKNTIDTALRRREQPQAVQRKKHEMEL